MKQYRFTDALAQLFVRNTEIVAVIPCPLEDKEAEEQEEEEGNNSKADSNSWKLPGRQQLLVTLNPQR